MGRSVLDPGVSSHGGLYVYAHCNAATPGGVTVLAINASRSTRRVPLTLPTASERYSLHARRLQDKTVQLNGRTLTLGANDELPALEASPTPAGVV